MGDEVLDAEHPSELEAKLVPNHAVAKWLWFLVNPFFAAVRTPLLLVRKYEWELSLEEVLNHVLVYAFDLYLIYTGRIELLLYLLFASLVAMQTHMFGFWGVSVHVEFFKYRENYSYYGWMNQLFMNFGYHQEHHDFPAVPARLLPKVSHRVFVANFSFGKN